MIELEPRRFTFDEFIALGEGLGHCELFDGHIYVMSPRSDRHTLVCAAVYAAVVRGIDSLGLTNDVLVVTEPTLRLDAANGVEPDIAVIEGPRERYVAERISPRRVRLIIEVAETSLRHDLGEKVRRYAGAGIPEYWVVDARERCIHAFSVPRNGTYARSTQVNNRIASESVPSLALDIVDITA